MNNNSGDGTLPGLPGAEQAARLARLNGIAGRHLEKLGKLPIPDQLTVTMVLLGAVVQQVVDHQQLALLDHAVEGIRGNLLAGLQGAGA